MKDRFYQLQTASYISLYGGGAKTKITNPYDYDPFTTWQNPNETPNDSVYSDRLYSWDPKKYNEACLKHFGNHGQNWGSRKPKQIESFLRDYLSRPQLTLCEIIEGCNQSSGFPYWCFLYKI